MENKIETTIVYRGCRVYIGVVMYRFDLIPANNKSIRYCKSWLLTFRFGSLSVHSRWEATRCCYGSIFAFGDLALFDDDTDTIEKCC